MEGVSSYRYICLLRARETLRTPCGHRHGDGALPNMAHASSSLTEAQQEMRSFTRPLSSSFAEFGLTESPHVRLSWKFKTGLPLMLVRHVATDSIGQYVRHVELAGNLIEFELFHVDRFLDPQTLNLNVTRSSCKSRSVANPKWCGAVGAQHRCGFQIEVSHQTHQPFGVRTCPVHCVKLRRHCFEHVFWTCFDMFDIF